MPSTLSLVTTCAFLDWFDYSLTLATMDLQAAELVEPVLLLLPWADDGGTPVLSTDTLISPTRALVLWTTLLLACYLLRIAAAVYSGLRCKPRPARPLGAIFALLAPLLAMVTVLPASPGLRLALACAARLLANLCGGVESVAAHQWISAMADAGERQVALVSLRPA